MVSSNCALQQYGDGSSFYREDALNVIPGDVSSVSSLSQSLQRALGETGDLLVLITRHRGTSHGGRREKAAFLQHYPAPSCGKDQ